MHPAAALIQKDYFLQPGTASIRGQVTDQSGRPLAGVKVKAAFGGFFSPGQTERLLPVKAESDARGKFEIKGLAAETVWLHLASDGYLLEGTTMPLADGDVKTVEFRMRRGLQRRVLVTDFEGVPLPRAVVATFDRTLFPADAEGVARIVVPEENRLAFCSVFAPGYLTSEIELDLDAGPIHVVLEPGPELRGVVLTPEGQPVSGAEITVTGAGRFLEETVRSDARGRFSIRLSKPPASSVQAAAPGFVEAQLSLDGVARRDDLEIRLHRPNAVLFGFVVDSEGVPVRLFDIQLRQGDKVYRRSFNEPSGRFVVRDILAGTYEMFVSSTQPELLGVAVRKESVEIPSGQTVGELLFRFPPPRDR